MTGFATLYDRVAWTGDGTVRIIRPGAFAECLSKNARVEFWINHLPDMCIGSTDRELELLDSPKGLAFRFKFPDTTLGTYARTLAADGKYTGMSVGFWYKEYSDEEREGLPVRIVTKAELQEISFCESGAIKNAFGSLTNPDSSLAEDIRSKLEWDGAHTRVMRALKSLEDSLKYN